MPSVLSLRNQLAIYGLDWADATFPGGHVQSDFTNEGSLQGRISPDGGLNRVKVGQTGYSVINPAKAVGGKGF